LEFEVDEAWLMEQPCGGHAFAACLRSMFDAYSVSIQVCSESLSFPF
jgi:hypothetical protein